MKEFVLTRIEIILILRLRSGLNQSDFARSLKMSRSTYGKIESGEKVAFDSKNDMDAMLLNLRSSADGTFHLRPHERCVVLRRRLKLGQSDVAKMFKKSVNWISLMETEEVHCDEYLAFLEKLYY